VVTIKPGDKETKRSVGEGTARSTTTTQDAIMDLIRNIFPENLVQATIQQGYTQYVFESEPIIKPVNSTDDSNKANNQIYNKNKSFPNNLALKASPSHIMKKTWTFRYNDNTNILGVIAFCIAFGMIISSMGRKAEILLHLFLVLNEITMKFVKIIMW
jgi:Na+/H+-dicarboxylate symporter